MSDEAEAVIPTLNLPIPFSMTVRILSVKAVGVKSILADFEAASASISTEVFPAGRIAFPALLVPKTLNSSASMLGADIFPFKSVKSPCVIFMLPFSSMVILPSRMSRPLRPSDCNFRGPERVLMEAKVEQSSGFPCSGE